MHKLPQEIQEKLKQLKEKFNEIPVPVIAIAKDLGIKIYETMDFNNTESGSIKKENGDYVIYLNALDSPTRKRFTVAHEIGHFFLHKDFLNQGHESVTTVKQPLALHRPSPNKPVNSAEKDREVAANYFAAELLMPADEFRKEFENSNNIDELADKFLVSPSAAAVRAESLLGQTII